MIDKIGVETKPKDSYKTKILCSSKNKEHFSYLLEYVKDKEKVYRSILSNITSTIIAITVGILITIVKIGEINIEVPDLTYTWLIGSLVLLLLGFVYLILSIKQVNDLGFILILNFSLLPEDNFYPARFGFLIDYFFSRKENRDVWVLTYLLASFITYLIGFFLMFLDLLTNVELLYTIIVVILSISLLVIVLLLYNGLNGILHIYREKFEKFVLLEDVFIEFFKEMGLSQKWS